MNKLINQFCTYDISLKLKKLHFNDQCFGYYNERGTLIHFKRLYMYWNDNERIIVNRNIINIFNKKFARKTMCLSPLWQQAIYFFDTKGLFITINTYYVDGVIKYKYILQYKSEYLVKDNFNSSYEATENSIIKAIELYEIFLNEIKNEEINLENI